MRLLTAVLCLACSPAWANLRAPREELQPSSAALRVAPDSAAAAPRLIVRAETLTLACDRTCQVTADYEIVAAAGARLAFEFVLPQQTAPIEVRLDGEPGAQSVATEAVAQDEAARYRTPLARARFTGRVNAGVGHIQVRYQQPPQREERDYGYFKDGRFISSLRYELWPLREWRLAPDFALHLSVRVAQRRPGLLKRTFSKILALRCEGLRSGSTEPLPGHAVQQATELVYQATLPAAFPDRLRCSFGDSDLLR